MKTENAEAIISKEKKISDFYVGGMDVEKFEKIFKNKFAVHHLSSQRVFALSVLGLQPGQSAVVANGRVGHRPCRLDRCKIVNFSRTTLMFPITNFITVLVFTGTVPVHIF